MTTLRPRRFVGIDETGLAQIGEQAFDDRLAGEAGLADAAVDGSGRQPHTKPCHQQFGDLGARQPVARHPHSGGRPVSDGQGGDGFPVVENFARHEAFLGWLVSDGYVAYRDHPRRQRCLAHLIRKGIGLADGFDYDAAKDPSLGLYGPIFCLLILTGKRKSEVSGNQLDEKKQGAFIASYENLMNSLGSDEAVLFADAVHPTHAARPVGCWAPKQDKLAIEQTSGRQRVNIHGAIDLETGQTRMIEVETVDAVSTIKLLEAIEALYPLRKFRVIASSATRSLPRVLSPRRILRLDYMARFSAC